MSPQYEIYVESVIPAWESENSMLERKKQHTTSAFNRKAKLLNKNKKNPGTEKSIIKSMQAPRGWINDRKRCVAYGICFYVFFFLSQ